MSIHPFDFDKIDSKEYQGIIAVAKKHITKFGVTNFAGFTAESQYRVYVWAAYLTLKLENNNPAILSFLNKGITIKEHCTEVVSRREIPPLTDRINQNKKDFISNL
ncbi:hypothetical protein GCM10023115_24660 [Pontixanthobacter gangjinensis]